MQYQRFGKSGLRVSRAALGTMTFGEAWGWGANYEGSEKILNAYIEAGGNFIDTASSYTCGESETYIGRMLEGRRDSIVLATKYTHMLRHGDVNSAGNHRKSLRQSLDQSLKRLNTDHIDLFWVHCWDKITPLEEILRALDDAVRAGKILYAGFSDAPAWLISRADALAEFKGWSPFIGIQTEYSLISRHAERDLLPMARELGLGVAAWGPLGAGTLTGKYTENKSVNARRIDAAKDFYGYLLNNQTASIAKQAAKVAKDINATSAQVALAWMAQSNSFIIPILGARTQSQLLENLLFIEVSLSNHHLQELNKASDIELGFPHEFLDSAPVRYLSFAGDRTADDFQQHS